MKKKNRYLSTNITIQYCYLLEHENNNLCLHNVTRKLILMHCKRNTITCLVADSVSNNELVQKFYKHAICLATRFAGTWHSIKSNYFNNFT